MNSYHKDTPKKQKRQHSETQFILDDLASRFIINLPREELESLERLCFHLEAAWWFYDDFYRNEDPNLPPWNLKDFAKQMFSHCPLLKPHLEKHTIPEIIFAFNNYKLKVPVCGAILLNKALDKILLVKGWSSRSSWGFPKGKINKDEPENICAIREVEEETGFDLNGWINENDFFETFRREQKIKLYIVGGISENTVFAPKKIEWFPVSSLPSIYSKESSNNSNNYWTILPFIPYILDWIDKQQGRTPRSQIEKETQKDDTKMVHLLEKLDLEVKKKQSLFKSREDDPWINFRFDQNALLDCFNFDINKNFNQNNFNNNQKNNQNNFNNNQNNFNNNQNNFNNNQNNKKFQILNKPPNINNEKIDYSLENFKGKVLFEEDIL